MRVCYRRSATQLCWPTGSRLAAMGMYRPDDLVDEMREALRRAESFGDICGIIAAQLAYGTALLHADKASHDEAIDVLERARANIRKHRVHDQRAGDHRR